MPRMPRGTPKPQQPQPEVIRELPVNAAGEEYVPWQDQPLEDQVSPDGSTMDEFRSILAGKGVGVTKYHYPNDFRSLHDNLSADELRMIRYDDLTDEELRLLGNPRREDHRGTQRHPGVILEEGVESVLDDRGVRDGIRYGLEPGSFVPGELNLAEEPGQEHVRSRHGVRISPRSKKHGAHRPDSPGEYEPRLTEEWGKNIGRRIRESAVVEGAARTIRSARESLRPDPDKHRRKL